MRLQAERAPDAGNGRLTQPDLRRHRAGAPVRGIAGGRFQGQRHDLFHVRIGNLPRRARPRLIEQAVQPLHEKSPTPLADGLLLHPRLARDGGVRLARGAREDNARAQRDGLGRRAPTRPPLQRVVLLGSQRQRRHRTSCAHESSCYGRNARCTQLVPSIYNSGH
jgi:hypothetical protein